MNVTYKLYRFIEQNGRAEYKVNRVKGGERALSTRLTYSIDKPLETESLVLHILLTVWVGKCKAKQHKIHTHHVCETIRCDCGTFLLRQHCALRQLLGYF